MASIRLRCRTCRWRFNGLRKEFGKSVLITDHNVEQTLKGARIRALIIVDGEVMAEGTPRQLVNNSAVRAAYFGNYFVAMSLIDVVVVSTFKEKLCPALRCLALLRH